MVGMDGKREEETEREREGEREIERGGNPCCHCVLMMNQDCNC